jgi:Flp pilus assembly protein TadD
MGHGQQHLEDALRRVCATAMPAPDQVAAVIDRIAAHVVGSVDIDPDVLVQTLALVLARWPDRVALASRTRATAATALQRRRRWIEARQLLLEAEEARLRQQIERTPANARAWGALALFLKNQRPDYDEAERCYRRAAELAPHDPSQVFNLGLFLTRVRGRHDDGEALMRHALESAPNDAILLSGFAFFLHHERGLPAEAEVLYQKALGIAPTEASILGNVASVRLAEGRLPEARELIERSVKTEADSDVTLRALFLGAVAARLAGADPAPWIAQLRQLLGRGIAGNPWHPRGLMAELPRRLQAGDARFFATLQAFLFPLSGRTVEAQELEEFEAWRGAVGAEIDAV